MHRPHSVTANVAASHLKRDDAHRYAAGTVRGTPTDSHWLRLALVTGNKQPEEIKRLLQ